MCGGQCFGSCVLNSITKLLDNGKGSIEYLRCYSVKLSLQWKVNCIQGAKTPRPVDLAANHFDLCTVFFSLHSPLWLFCFSARKTVLLFLVLTQVLFELVAFRFVCTKCKIYTIVCSYSYRHTCEFALVLFLCTESRRAHGNSRFLTLPQSEPCKFF